jgi:MoxR-like ATPase
VVPEPQPWFIYRGTRQPHDGISSLPDPPPWRKFARLEPISPPVTPTEKEAEAGANYRPDPATVELVNAAIYLRRPLLVTGRPGTGKSTLAASIAFELGLGRVLRWNVTTKTVMRDGLYQYDPLARLYAASRRNGAPEADEDIGQYIRLGPLGTALLPSARPRVLLIDEVDKSDLDLPNDLLTAFEDGEFEIPELVRQAERFADAEVSTTDSLQRVRVHHGRVRCSSFPIVVMTSNGEREFPPAFLRRCIPVQIQQPDRAKLDEIVAAHLPGLSPTSAELITRFLNADDPAALATDQLLNAIYLTHAAARAGDLDQLGLAEKLWTPLIGRTR